MSGPGELLILIFSDESMPQNENPKLRNGLEALPIEYSGKNMMLLRDRIGYAKEQLVFSQSAISIIAKMNGGNSLRDIQAEFMRETGQLVYIEELNGLVQTLDDHLFLDNEKFRKHAAGEIAAFLDSPVRKMYHAGQSYPLDPDKLRSMLDSFFRPENGGPGLPNAANSGKKKIVGLVAPHIDLNAGGTCFAHAYKTAAESECPDTWIILGTGHDIVDNCFALTVKDFETPLGNIPCDSEVCSELLRSSDFDLRASEYNHRDRTHDRISGGLSRFYEEARAHCSYTVFIRTGRMGFMQELCGLFCPETEGTYLRWESFHRDPGKRRPCPCGPALWRQG